MTNTSTPQLSSDHPSTTLRIEPSRTVLALSLLVGLLALFCAGFGLLSSGGPGRSTFNSIHGQSVQLYGQGLYRGDSVFKAAGNRGTDLVTLVVGIPLLLGAALLYRRGSSRAALLLSGMHAYFLYVYATMALGAMYGPLFLAYVATYSASLFALIGLLTRLLPLAPRFSPALPRRRIAAFLFSSGFLTLGVWLGPILGASLAGEPPGLLQHYTTMVTDALDLGLIVPTVFLSATLIARRQPTGYLIAFPLILLVSMLLPVIVAQTVLQLSAGVTFKLPEIIGPFGGFLVAAQTVRHSYIFRRFKA